MPHPSEEKVNLRIQTRPEATAEGAFKQGLADLASMAEHIKATFAEALESDKREAGGAPEREFRSAAVHAWCTSIRCLPFLTSFFLFVTNAASGKGKKGSGKGKMEVDSDDEEAESSKKSKGASKKK
jgi:RNA polymerase Rpb3/Rpb11 dimerisation domain